MHRQDLSNTISFSFTAVTCSCSQAIEIIEVRKSVHHFSLSAFHDLSLSSSSLSSKKVKRTFSCRVRTGVGFSVMQLTCFLLSSDGVLERAMHKCILKPLKSVLSTALQEFQVRSGAWQELKENMSTAKARQPEEMGVSDTLPPDPVSIEKIRHKFQTMCKLYSPEKKVTMLLRVCKLIYGIMENNSGSRSIQMYTNYSPHIWTSDIFLDLPNQESLKSGNFKLENDDCGLSVCLSGRLYGADDFLPMLTYVLAQCDMPQLDNEILYMMELLDPSLLHGEGGFP